MFINFIEKFDKKKNLSVPQHSVLQIWIYVYFTCPSTSTFLIWGKEGKNLGNIIKAVNYIHRSSQSKYWQVLVNYLNTYLHRKTHKTCDAKII